MHGLLSAFAMTASLTTRLVAILGRPIDGATRRRATLHVLDWLGCALIGAVSEPGRILVQYGRRQPPGPAAAIGAQRREAGAAAFLNGGLGNTLEMDDLHRTSIVHPGPVVVPAALATAQRTGAGALAFLDAVVRGYEAAIRVGSATGLGHYRFWHNTSTCGVFGAAAAAAALLELSPERTVAALGHAGGQACGLWQCRLEPTMSKQLYTARAAQSGLIAADLAGLGAAAAERILEGPLGFFAATCPDAAPELVIADARAPWKLFEISFKPWPACRHAHPVIEAALRLRAGLEVDRIAAIEVRTYEDAVDFCDQPTPGTPLEGRFSLQHAIAVTLLGGAPKLADFEPDALAHAETAALRAKVRVVSDDAYTRAFPERYGAEVSIALDDGSSRRETVATAKGDPENPMSREEIEVKARTLMAAASLSENRIETLVAAVLTLADGGPLAALGEGIDAAWPEGLAA